MKGDLLLYLKMLSTQQFEGIRDGFLKSIIDRILVENGKDSGDLLVLEYSVFLLFYCGGSSEAEKVMEILITSLEKHGMTEFLVFPRELFRLSAPRCVKFLKILRTLGYHVSDSCEDYLTISKI